MFQELALVLQVVRFAWFLVYFPVALKRVYELSWLVAAVKVGWILFG
jgi:hypothetical protein